MECSLYVQPQGNRSSGTSRSHQVHGAGPDLMGRDWLTSFEVTLGEVNHLEDTDHPWALQEMLDKYSEVFDGDLAGVHEGGGSVLTSEAPKQGV